jgi:hypothetical protein
MATNRNPLAGANKTNIKALDNIGLIAVSARDRDNL